MNKILFGFQNVSVAFLDPAATEGPDWLPPQKIPGAVSFSPSAEGDSNPFYADDSTYYTLSSNNGYTADLEVALVPDAILAKMLGWEIDTNGMLVEVADGIPQPFALMGQISGDSKNRKFAYYNCTAARPEDEHNTKSDSTDPDTTTLSLTIIPLEIDGKKIVKGTIEESDTNKTVYDAFFTAVTKPTFPVTP
jgi:phi13 family phage major tail protein